MSVRLSPSHVDWLLFLLLSFFWGSSYLFIKIGVGEGLQPFTLVTIRLLIGFLLLAAVVLALRVPLPRRGRTYGHLVVLGFSAVALPFFLITWAAQFVDSALTATLTAPVPLFVIPIAALMLGDEGITINKVVGVTVGMVGVAILMGFDIAEVGRADLTPQLALVGAAASYALAGVYARRFVHGLRAMIPSMFQVFFAMLMSAAAAFALERPIEQAAGLSLTAIFAVIWLGLLGSGMAYLLFYRLLGRWGPTRISLVAYTLPVWGIALGWLVLNEQIHEGLVLGTALVIGGIAIVNNAHRGVWRRLSRASLEQGR
ncbi:MAG TPA: DMT family transporter [Candidatus Limnocylindrales bacterium]|nr:DMT family transporter [Candidatus Limnocylindrales bacterium]